MKTIIIKLLIPLLVFIVLIGGLIILYMKAEKSSKNNGEVKHKRLSPKKQKKLEEKRKQDIRSTLDWMDLQEINEKWIRLERNKKTLYVKGIEITPVNIHLVSSTDKVKYITNLANALDTLKFPIYWKFVLSKPEINYQIGRYIDLMEKETNPNIRRLGEVQIRKLEWFKDAAREVKFFALIQSDNDHLDKMYSQLTRALSRVFNIKEMSKADYCKVVQQEFDNDIVNEYMFSQLILPDTLQEDIEEFNREKEEV